MAESVFLAKNGEFEKSIDVIRETSFYNNEAKYNNEYVVLEMAVMHFLEQKEEK
jgi:hypothetical protein